MECKNIREKLQKARMLLKEESISKTGYNNYNRQHYFTLQDIEPPITKVCNEIGMTPIVTYTSDSATLTIYDWDSDETIVVTSPMVTINDEKISAIQSLGSIETYQKRYLLSNAFALVEETEEKGESTDFHDIMIIKERLEAQVTQALKKGIELNDLISKMGLQNEKTYMSYLNACVVLDKAEKKLREILKK